MCQKTHRLRVAHVYIGRNLFRAREKEIVRTIVEPRKDTAWRVIHNNSMRESMGSCELCMTPSLQMSHVHSREQGTGACRELEEICTRGNLAAAKGSGRSDVGVDPTGR